MTKMQLYKWSFVGVLTLVATVCFVWLSGVIFFAFSKANPFGRVDLFTWWTYWEFYRVDPLISKRLLIAAGVAAVIAYGIPIAAMIAALRDSRSLHGDARFATSREISNAGLFGSEGIIVGKWKQRFLLFPGSQFVLLAAPTRSGKGVGIVVPNLLNFADSVVVLDVKLENFLITSKYRAQHGQDVFLFNPFASDGKTHRYNPLGYIRDDPRSRVTDILSIGYVLYPGMGRESFFDDAARNLFLGLTLYLCETPTLPRTIGELLRQSSGKGRPVKDYLQRLIVERNASEEHSERSPLPPLSMECVDALNRFTSTSENTLSSILATFNVPLTIWVSPLVDAATSANDFDLRQVRKKRMSIYLGIPANRLAEAELIINLFFSQLINHNTDVLLHSTPEIKYQCLLLMDEFSAPGRIGIIDKSNAYIAGYGLRLLTIIQSPGQIESEPRKGYGKEGARTLITNHALQILYTPRQQKDANEYSEMLGTYTFKAKSVNLQERSKGSESDQRRALRLPQELKEMSQRKQIISLENVKAIMCDKIAYYEDPVFVDRLKTVSPALAMLGRKLPTQAQLEHAWGTGELAVGIEALDLDLHDATIHNRRRPLTTADITNGIDLNALTANISRVRIPEGSEIDPEKIELFVNDFFDALDASNADGQASRNSIEEVVEYDETNVTDPPAIDLSVLLHPVSQPHATG